MAKTNLCIYSYIYEHFFKDMVKGMHVSINAHVKIQHTTLNFQVLLKSSRLI